MIYINEINLDMLSCIFEYLHRRDVGYLLTTSTSMLEIYKSKQTKYIIRNIINEKYIYDKSAYNISEKVKKQIRKHLKENIPEHINSIYLLLTWYNVYLNLLRYYNLFLFNNNVLLLTSKTNLDMFEIFRSILKLSKYDNKLITMFNNTNKIKEIHMKKKLTIIAQFNTYRYHQLTYENFIDFTNELHLKLI